MTISIGTLPDANAPGQKHDTGFADSVSGVAGEALDFGQCVKIDIDGAISAIATAAELDDFTCGILEASHLLASETGAVSGDACNVMLSGRIAHKGTALANAGVFLTFVGGALGTSGDVELDLARAYGPTVVQVANGVLRAAIQP